MPDTALTAKLREASHELGADLFGVAPVSRYEEAGAPLHMRPTGLLPGATCAAVVAIHHPDAAVEMGGEPDPQTQGPYSIQNRMNERLEHIMFRLGDMLEREGHRVVGIAATNIWRFRGRPEEDNPFLPDLSNIHAAWAAGLGEIGWSGLLLSPEFGPRQRFCCLVTDAPLEPSPMYSGEPLCDRCDMCVKHCPTQAFEKEVTGEVVLTADGSTVRYCEKSKWRCAWAEHFGLDLDLPKPDVITEEVLLEQLAEHGVRGGEMGSCLRFCMAAPLRVFDYEYTRAPRRKRPGPSDELERLAREAREIAAASGATTWAWVMPQMLKADLMQVLPDAESAFILAVPAPAGSGAPVAKAAASWADFIELDVARMLERAGHSAVPRTGLDKTAVARAAGLPTEDVALGCVVSSVGLASPREVVMPGPPPGEAHLASTLEADLRASGAHLVGVASSETLDGIVGNLREAFDEEALRINVRDAGPTHGATVPVVEPKPLPVIKGPEDHLPGARAVLVIGVHHPFENLGLAGEPPAASAGPYAYAVYQTARELEYLAWQTVAKLTAWGYRAVAVADLCGAASQVATPRGLQPDALCSRFAAQAAGLATIGWHGAPLTPEFGVTQRFISIVTDAPLTPSEARDLANPCGGCERPCVSACPVSAISSEATTVADYASFGALDCLRCDWAKKYAFLLAEGPGLMGQTTDIAPPDGQIAVDDIVAAMADKDPVQRHWTCIVEPCLQACHRRLQES